MNDNTKKDETQKKIHGYFYAIPARIAEKKDITSTSKLVYGLILGMNANRECWAGNDYISTKLGISIASARRAIDQLCSKGLVERTTSQSRGSVLIRYLVVIDEGQNEPRDEGQNEPHEGQNEPRDEGQNEPLLDNTLNKRIRSIDYTRVKTSFSGYFGRDLDETLAEQLRGKEWYEDERGRTRYRLRNGKVSMINYPDLFLTSEEAKKISERFKRVFKDDWKEYLDVACEKWLTWASDNPKQSLKKKSHYRCLINWPLDAAKEDFLRDLKNKNQIEIQKKYSR